MDVNELEIEVDTPLTVVISAITAVTPMSIPKIVSAERSRFWRMLESDMRTFSKNIVSPGAQGKRTSTHGRLPPVPG